MCGIAGILSRRGRDGAGKLARPLLERLRHRGPDDHGWLISTPVGVRLGRGLPDEGRGEVLFIHRRLSILDLSDAGWQPMGTPDGRYFLAFNGEIYNFLELRHELEACGHVFRSHSDTEVLLHALAEWGTLALPRLVGMFALALLDRVKRTILLARDPFGIKPLYCADTPDGLAFASELKALLTVPGIARDVNPRRLYEYLVAGRTDHGAETLFAHVRQVPAAHYQIVSLDDDAVTQPVRYWRVDLADRLDISYGEATSRVRDLFLDNVRLHLRSDVPVGAALSGGIDSSAIVAAMRHVEPGLDLHTFSYIADEPELCEERWVDSAARAAGAVQHKVHATSDELADDLDALVYSQDEPFGSTSIYVQHRVFRLAAEAGVKVMLDGQGADEMLGGYRHYLAARLASLVRQGQWLTAIQFLRRCSRLPGMATWSQSLMQAIGMLVPAGAKALGKRLLGRTLMPPWLGARWFHDRGVAPFDLAGHRDRDVLRHHLHRTLVETSLPMLLRYEDRNSMAHSIESRVPFLTPQLADFLLRLPEAYLIGPDGTSKRVFRDAMRGIVPNEILDRKDKIGFATPEKRWFLTMSPWIERTLASDTARAIPALDVGGMQREWAEIVAGRRPFDFRVWRWLNVVRWAERFDVQFGVAGGSKQQRLAA